MFDTLSVFPAAFWVVILVFIAGIVLSFKRIKDGSGIPMLAVIGTVAAWYVGDAFYNDYAHSYFLVFDPDVLENAWWEVAWFLVVFLVAAPYTHRWFNSRYMSRQSGVLQLARFGVGYPVLQRQLDILFAGSAIIYIIIILIATIRIKGQILYYFFPFLGEIPEPWGRNRIGSGIDALLTFAFYIQMMVTTIFGVLGAVSTNPRTRFWALILCFLSWPCFIFDRTRNSMLAITIPAILSWVFLRLRGGGLKKVIILSALFILVNGWMAFIIQNRSSENIAMAFKQKGFNLEKASKVHHEGFNMFEELCWMNTFFKNGTFEPDQGALYFAELVNPIPRAIWHNKPLIGIDYSIARGMGVRGRDIGTKQANGQAGVYATVTTGMIGQGVVNFGGIVGPVTTALLMSFWVAILARQDLRIFELGRLPLYACGMILTFNLGRDITFITLYPFVFGAVALWWFDRHKPSPVGGNLQPAVFRNVIPTRPIGHSDPLLRRPVRKPVQRSIMRRRRITRPNS